ncbi:AMP-binding enzyme [Blastococcus brunescens]|uniref:AMP-binding enzyme n=1 Tax=Blastococcus brunescens TaxID=1564165 RepID=UPI003BEECF04
MAPSPAWSSSCGTRPRPTTTAGSTTPRTTSSWRGRGDLDPRGQPVRRLLARGRRRPGRRRVAGYGDLAYRDADGDLHLVDRRSDLVLVSGFNVYPAEVERVLDTHPAVAESAVIGVPDPTTGAAVRAVVVVRPGSGSPSRSSGRTRRSPWPATRCRRRCTSCRPCRTP